MAPSTAKSKVARPSKRPKRPKRAVPQAYLKQTFKYDEGRRPVHVYLSGLGEDSARVMGSALDSIADILSEGKLTAATLPWHRIRSEPTGVIAERPRQPH